jgi:Capsular polysaccharide biosynthesis protein
MTVYEAVGACSKGNRVLYFTDIHHHIMFDVDDGPPDFDQAKKMLATAAADGIANIIATPHLWGGMDTYADKLNMLNKYCCECGIPLHIFPGAEILFTGATISYLRHGQIPTLAGTRFILVEFGIRLPYLDIYAAVRELSHAGYVPILAHIERYPCLMHDIRRVYALREELYARVQVNCETLLRRQPWRIRNTINKLLAVHAVDYVATDAHDTVYRRSCMSDCFRRLQEACGTEYAAALTYGNQEEIISGSILAY